MAVTPRFILEDHPNPPGVVTPADLPDAPTQVPVSTKVHQMLAGKLQQCEQGVVNIIVFGNPRQMHDREISSAVLGVEVVSVPFTEATRMASVTLGMLAGNPKAPFSPAQSLANDDDRREFVDPFRQMSAVWHVRLGCDASAVCIPNPNAAVAAPDDLLAALADAPDFGGCVGVTASITVLSHQWVADNAYFRWRQSGRTDGHDVRHWLEAETEKKTISSISEREYINDKAERSVLGRPLSTDVAALLTGIGASYGL